MAKFVGLRSLIKPFLIIGTSVLVVAAIVSYVVVPDRITVALTTRAGSDPAVSSSLMQPTATSTGRAENSRSLVLYGSVDAEGGQDLQEIAMTIVSTKATAPAPAATFSVPHAGNYRVSASLPPGDYTVSVGLLVDGRPVSHNGRLHVSSADAYEISLLVSASSPLFFFVPVPSY